jgi:CheY-like chemotaxis protein
MSMSHRILVVDDNEIVGWTLQVRLWAAEHQVTYVSSANAALEALAVQRFDLVLLDLHMPDIGGLEALEMMNARDLCLDTPVVLLTSSDELKDIQKASLLGARGYLTKAEATRSLLHMVDRLLEEPNISWLDDYSCVFTPSQSEGADTPRLRLVSNRSNPTQS